jgi:uncharacterized repeat protein (TIGR03803 family)
MTNQAPHRNWSWQRCLGVATGTLALVIVLGRVVIATPSAEARADYTFTLLYSFFRNGNKDGASPVAGLVRDAAGNLYGTTYFGGGKTRECSSGCGTVFKLDATGTESVLYRFKGGTDGKFPLAGLVPDAAGHLYGTTREGGISNNCPAGCGTVFMLDTTGAETVLYRFMSLATDGQYPSAGLIRDAAGNLYGTTYWGGTSDSGTVFKLDTTGTETVLFSFTGTDGAHPVAGLIRDVAGNFYGTASGVVYEFV